MSPRNLVLAVLAVLLLLLLAAQMTTAISLLLRQSWVTPSSESCGPDEYWSSGRCCKGCPAGQHVSEHCRSSHTRGRCVMCVSGTFMKFPNGLEACFKCSTCTKDEEEVAGCTLTRDRVCQCRPGHFYLHPGSSEICSRCSRCPKGHVVVQRCNTTEDTVCSFPGLERRHWWSLIGSFLFVSVVVTLFFWLSKKPTGCMSAHPGLSNGVGDHRQSMLPEHSVCSLPANQDRGAQSAVHMMENFSPSKDSLDVMSEAPTATRTLESLAGVNGPQAAAGERGRTPQPMPSAPSEPELPVDLQQLPLEAISLAVGSRKHVEERGNGGHSRLLPSRLCGAPWRGWRGVYPVRGAGCGQLTEQSRIGWHQGDISSIITLLVSTSPRVYVPVVSSFHLKGDLLPVKTT
ncbi:tumor necrosis factor receptor superfamily member 1B-like isoform X2 [Hippopotamus amphibius kiboko]|uniref:tumor necrosis factor receptor superfamily member 1B-like isoform X2 n=1 Tax=Hippopotamus amphibius kiboko TaxID=575201 RepID=UPI002594D4CE|nr:tumor necrosis factor receptor superfamily member 1B-like isoform X2 [Hippopotamus amphibius kiboko]